MRLGFWGAARRVFDLSLGEILWSRRTIFMALIVGGPVLLALIVRGLEVFGMTALRVNGRAVGGIGVFGVMMWMLFLRFIVPVLAVFYGTALMADEVDDKTLTYLQIAFTPGQHLEQIRRMEKLLAPEVMTHTEFIRNIDGHMICTALQLIRFSTEERLQAIMKTYRDHGIRVNDPHVFIVEDGRHQGVLAPGAIEMKKRFDPLGLLNPGKVRAWMSGVPG